ncbi:MAG: hypothetical protein A2X78_05055 [Gammaproteobacteria bacterium GWE2_37_16]|nr:MAG: hypothetical protein A2X78_05055 [Gammaproteobacteria bacterium GWE2_37_16]
MFEFAKKDLSTWPILCDAFSLYLQTFSRTWRVFLCYFIISVYYVSGYVGGIFPLNNFEKVRQEPLLMSFYFIGIIIVAFVALYFKGVALHRMHEIVTRFDAKLSDSFAFVRHKYWRIWGNQFLVGTMVLAILFPLIVPGVFLGILLVLCIPLILFDDKSVTEAIKDSCGLVWGNWWHTLAAIVLPMMAGIGINVYLPHLFQKGLPGVVSGAVLMVVNSFFVMPVLWAIILVLFEDLRSKDESSDRCKGTANI